MKDGISVVERFVTSGPTRIAYRDTGTPGPDVVLLHGGFSNLEYFAPLAERLADRCRVVSYDLRGHGHSDTGPSALRDHGDDLCVLIDELGLEQPIAIGVSYGAFVALEVGARERAALGAIVNIDGPLLDRDDAAEWVPDHPGWDERRETFRASIAARPDQWSGSGDELAERLSTVPVEDRAFEARKYVEDGKGGYVEHPDAQTSADMLMTSRAPIERLYRQISVPALVLVGTQSGVIFDDVKERQSAARRLAEAHPELDVRFVEGPHDLVRANLDGVVSEISSWMAAAL